MTYENRVGLRADLAIWHLCKSMFEVRCDRSSIPLTIVWALGYGTNSLIADCL